MKAVGRHIFMRDIRRRHSRENALTSATQTNVYIVLSGLVPAKRCALCLMPPHVLTQI